MSSLFSSADLSDLDFEPSGLAIGSDAADLLFREGRTAYAFTDEEVTTADRLAGVKMDKWSPSH